jgi:hypothetical protein
MRKSLWIILAVLLGAGAGVARADDITFIVSGSLAIGSPGSSCASPCTLGGTLTINNVTGALVSADITLSGESPTYGPFTTYQTPYPTSFEGSSLLDLYDSVSDVMVLHVSNPTPGSWVGFDGGSILPFVTSPTGVLGYSGVCPPPGCDTTDSGHFVITAGSLTPVPEPSSYLLLGTGLLGLLALTARSKRHAPPTPC